MLRQKLLSRTERFVYSRLPPKNLFTNLAYLNTLWPEGAIRLEMNNYKFSALSIVQHACETQDEKLAKFGIKRSSLADFRPMIFRAIVNSCPRMMVLLWRECMRRVGVRKSHIPGLLNLRGVVYDATRPGVNPRTFAIIHKWLDEDFLISYSNFIMLRAVNSRNMKVMKLLKQYMVRSSIKIALGSMLDMILNEKLRSAKKPKKKFTKTILKWTKELRNFEFRVGFTSYQKLH